MPQSGEFGTSNGVPFGQTPFESSQTTLSDRGLCFSVCCSLRAGMVASLPGRPCAGKGSIPRTRQAASKNDALRGHASPKNSSHPRSRELVGREVYETRLRPRLFEAAPPPFEGIGLGDPCSHTFGDTPLARAWMGMSEPGGGQAQGICLQHRGSLLDQSSVTGGESRCPQNPPGLEPR